MDSFLFLLVASSFVTAVAFELPVQSADHLKISVVHKKWVDPIEIVLDLDGTLVYALPEGKPDVYVRHIPFAYAPGAVEFLSVLAKVPHLHLHFFSAGEAWRNKELVKGLMHRVFMKTFRLPRYNILSKENVSYGNAPDVQMGRKNLLLIQDHIDLENTILVDDHCTAYPNQEQNLIKLMEGLGEFQKGTNESIEVSHNLARALGVILLAVDESRKSSIHFKTAVNQLLKDSDETHQENIMLTGLAAMKKITPRLDVEK